jgi:hypothetical protein
MRQQKLTTWKKSYTWVLLANVIYILVFFFLMQLYS